ncbi:hypothetical protein ACK2FH_25675 [Escherichia coli]
MFALTFQNHTNRPLTDFGGKTSIFSHPVYLFLREFSLQDSRGGSTSGQGIRVVDAQNGATTEEGAFALSRPLQAGAFNYTLNRDSDEDWCVFS